MSLGNYKRLRYGVIMAKVTVSVIDSNMCIDMCVNIGVIWY